MARSTEFLACSAISEDSLEHSAMAMDGVPKRRSSIKATFFSASVGMALVAMATSVRENGSRSAVVAILKMLWHRAMPTGLAGRSVKEKSRSACRAK